MTEKFAAIPGATYALADSLELQTQAKPAAMTVHSATRDLVHVIDDLDLNQFAAVAGRFGQKRYGYAVTPNVDHLIRYHEDAEFRALYRSAEYVLMDSRFVARVLKLFTGVKLRICTGSDLTSTLLSQAAKQDRIVVVGGSEDQIEQLRTRYGLTNLRHHNPPMGFIKDPLAVEQCLQFIESESPFRYCFLAVGSPQQEIIANLLGARGTAKGLALCVGASINYITGAEKRAPQGMQKLCLEWLYRLMQNPRRMARRYLVRGPRIFMHLRRARFVVRGTPAIAE